MREDNVHRRLTEEARLLRIAEMHGQAAVRGRLAAPVAGVWQLEDRDLYLTLLRQMSPDDKARWMTAFDWVMKPFTLHVVRFEPKADSLRAPQSFGDWRVIDQGTLADGADGFKLQRDNGARTYRFGWFDEGVKQEADRAVVVIRWDERLLEIRASYTATVKLADVLKESMRLSDVRVVNFTYDEHEQLLDRFNASYISATLNTQDQEIGELVIKSSPGQRLNRRREVALRLGADGATPEREIRSAEMTRESGWYVVDIAGDTLFAQFHRGRGTFHTKALLSEAHIAAVLEAIRAVKGY